jgi:hypothetical protein
VHCHQPQQRHTFTVSLDISCTPCHTTADAAAREDAVKSEILNSLLALKARMENWSTMTFKDPDLWDYPANVSAILDANGNPKVAPDQSLVSIHIKRARHNYYFVTNDHSFGVHNSVYTRLLLNVANTELDALGIPRAASIRSGLPNSRMIDLINRDIRRESRADMTELR